MAQYTLNVVALNGIKVTLPACLVAEVHDGKIVKLMEYTDSRKFRESTRIPCPYRHFV